MLLVGPPRGQNGQALRVLHSHALRPRANGRSADFGKRVLLCSGGVDDDVDSEVAIIPGCQRLLASIDRGRSPTIGNLDLECVWYTDLWQRSLRVLSVE